MMNNEHENYINALICAQIPHRITYTSRSVKVETHKGDIVFSPSDFKQKDLSFIANVKKEVIAAGAVQIKKEFDFYNIVWSKKDVPDALVEVDANMAYWFFAYKNGYICRKTYEKGLDVPKPVRLAAFGSAATIRRTAIFDGEKYSEFEETMSDAGRAAFFNVAYEVCSMLRDCCETVPGAFVLYWVDAVVCLPGWHKVVVERMEKEGCGHKVKHLEKCKFLNIDGEKSLMCTEAETGRVKTFRKRYTAAKSVSEIIKRHF
jgi:hypothetical protein